ncbi:MULTISPECIES: hypothetical protein [Rhodococcus]|uniref:Resolvase/invertase-type recombinase catalytic domain-containing protein n=1 Tax=Rhodococcus opacus TaxID=37919 RepID=A0AAX3Y8U3_RHOOP|nr:MULTISPECIES: hypothetical protein [Rhodococcus]WLF44584.1 hypothetical protein Q5707_21820 [Rhodococcus opacus]
MAQFLAWVAQDASVLGTCRGATGDTLVITRLDRLARSTAR